MLKTFWRPQTGVFLAVWLVLLAGAPGRLLRDPGTFWHPVAGRHLLANHLYLDHDPFSYTFGGRPWTPYEWLAECVMARLDDVSGLDTLLLAAVTLLAGLCAWLAGRLLRAGLHWSLAAVAVVLFLGAAASNLHARPHLLTIVFLGWTFALLTDYEAGRVGPGRLFWLVPLFVVWTNTHGGVLGGLATLGFAVVGWIASAVLRTAAKRTGRELAALVILLALCALTPLVNPYGFELPRTWYAIMSSPVVPRVIAEHLPLDPLRLDGVMVLLLALVYLGVLAGTWPARPRVTWLLPLAWLVLACTRVRHAPLFAVTAVLAVADMLPHTRWAAWLARSGSDLYRFPAAGTAQPSAGWRGWVIPGGLVLAALLLQAGRIPVPVLGHGWARLDAEHWPVELLPELHALEPGRAGDRHIFHEHLFGGFLIYHTPKLPVFIDDRCEVYGDRWLEEFVRAERGDSTAAALRSWQQRFGPFDLALTQPGSAFDAYFDTSLEWTPVKRTGAAVLYRRSEPPAGQASRTP
jgi:hypothetical protein